MALGLRRQPKWMGKLFYGWWIVFAGTMLRVLESGLVSQAFGAYFVHVNREFGWSKTALSGSSSLNSMERGFLGPVQGWLTDRFGPRNITRVGVVAFGVGFILLSRVHNLVEWYLAFLLIALGSGFTGWMTVNTLLTNWFRRRRAAVMGLTSAGMSLGGLAVPLVALFMEQHGWRAAAFWSGILVLAAGLPLAQMLRDSPEPYGLAPDGDPVRSGPDQAAPRTGVVAGPSEGYTTREAVRSSAFWLISWGHSLGVLVVTAVNVHLIPFLESEQGMSVERAASILAFMTLVTLVAQVIGGVAADLLNKRLVAALGMVGHCVGLLMLAFATNIWMVLGFAVIHGFAWGARAPVMSAIRADYFGRRAYASILGVSSLVVMVGSVGGPLVAGAMADLTGNYKAGFVILALISGAGTACWLFLRDPAPPKREPVAQR